MSNLGRKYACYSCHTKFYDLGKPTPLCPKCGADQRDAEDAPLVTSHRGRRVVAEPVEEEEIERAPEAAPDTEEEEFVPEVEKEAEEEEEEEDY